MVVIFIYLFICSFFLKKKSQRDLTLSCWGNDNLAKICVDGIYMPVFLIMQSVRRPAKNVSFILLAGNSVVAGGGDIYDLLPDIGSRRLVYKIVEILFFLFTKFMFLELSDFHVSIPSSSLCALFPQEVGGHGPPQIPAPCSS